uniref:ATP synthase complex subunit 8 n=1 Tax=Makalata didelphoides TaxID=30622 RepID=A0A1S5S7D9_MAKDI|nr:ATP synthase F0 subunit 8 [Makalata didelphoides]
MPQLDTSTWSTTILSMMITLFIILQLKTLTHEFPNSPQPTNMKQMKQKMSWEKKWTKIYLPLS